MDQRRVLGILAAVAVALAGLGGLTARAAEPAKAPGHGTSHPDGANACAKACADCMRACESCAHHCAQMVAEGKKDHLRTLGTCADCAEFCALAAKIVAHRGVMAVPACAACARACDTCGQECERCCEKSPDEHMKQCARACRDCAKACREMIKHAGHHAEGNHHQGSKGGK